VHKNPALGVVMTFHL